VRIVVWESDDVIKVPSSAVFRHDGVWALYVIDDDRARLTHVEIGERTARDVQILRGLEPEQRVVVHPGDAVRDGVRVVPR
jgi:HlyD family secretion protein